MVCQVCGSPLGPNVRFCANCGAQVVAAPQTPQPAGAPPYGVPSPQYASYPPYPPMMVVPRVQRHLQTLGTLWCVYAVYRAVTGFIGAVFVRAIFVGGRFGGEWPFGHPMGWGGPTWMHLMPVIVVATIFASLFAVFVGYSLLTRRSFGRVLAIVAGVLVLFKPLLGTALGIYTLWVLAPSASGLEYDSIAEPN